jgi:hypothetical protein
MLISFISENRFSLRQGLIIVWQKKEDAKTAAERRQIKYQKEHMYDDLHTDDNMQSSSNQDRNADWEDDFM